MGFKEFSKKLFPVSPVEDEELVYEDYEDEVTEDERTEVRPHTESFGTGRGASVTVSGGSSIEMKVVTPSRYDSVTQIADLLLSKKTVLLNLENTNKETAKRLIDFLSGVAYALHGDVQKVADNTYAITPSNVAVSKESVGMAQAPAQPQQTESELNF